MWSSYSINYLLPPSCQIYFTDIACKDNEANIAGRLYGSYSQPFSKWEIERYKNIFKGETQKRVVEKLQYICCEVINEKHKLGITAFPISLKETTCEQITDSKSNIQLACYAEFLSPSMLPLRWLILKSKFLVKQTNSLRLPDETNMTLYICKVQFIWWILSFQNL